MDIHTTQLKAMSTFKDASTCVKDHWQWAPIPLRIRVNNQAVVAGSLNPRLEGQHHQPKEDGLLSNRSGVGRKTLSNNFVDISWM